VILESAINQENSAKNSKNNSAKNSRNTSPITSPKNQFQNRDRPDRLQKTLVDGGGDMLSFMLEYKRLVYYFQIMNGLFRIESAYLIQNQIWIFNKFFRNEEIKF
jgi:hypothetical protein